MGERTEGQRQALTQTQRLRMRLRIKQRLLDMGAMFDIFLLFFFAQKHKKKETHSIRNERLNSKTVSGKWLTVKSSARNLCVVVFLEN